MNNDSQETLRLLMDRARQERDRLAGELRRAEEAALRARRQSEQLSDYRGEYLQRWSQQFGRGGAIEIVHCYQSFMQRLDEALVQQGQQIEAADATVASLRGQLMQAEMRMASVKKLMDRRQTEQLRSEDRRDQRQTDENAQSILRRNRQGLAVQH